VSITSPANYSSVTAGTTIAFAGSASDPEDGALSSSIVWTSSIDGQFGGGSSFSAALSTGTHTVTATVADKAGMSATAQVVVTVAATILPPPPTSGIVLSARGFKVRGLQRVDLTWLGATSSQINLYRDGSFILTTTNDGAQTDLLNTKGSGTYTYQACEAGTSTCSSPVVVVF
jgi:serine protease